MPYSACHILYPIGLSDDVHGLRCSRLLGIFVDGVFMYHLEEGLYFSFTLLSRPYREYTPWLVAANNADSFAATTHLSFSFTGRMRPSSEGSVVLNPGIPLF
jgi:hypothetical protein